MCEQCEWKALLRDLESTTYRELEHSAWTSAWVGGLTDPYHWALFGQNDPEKIIIQLAYALRWWNSRGTDPRFLKEPLPRCFGR